MTRRKPARIQVRRTEDFMSFVKYVAVIEMSINALNFVKRNRVLGLQDLGLLQFGS